MKANEKTVITDVEFLQKTNVPLDLLEQQCLGRWTDVDWTMKVIVFLGNKRPGSVVDLDAAVDGASFEIIQLVDGDVGIVKQIGHHNKVHKLIQRTSSDPIQAKDSRQ